MPLGVTNIDRMDDRLAAVRAALCTAMPDRVHKTGYRRMHDEHEPEELQVGVVSIVSAGETNYNDSPGMIAREGVQTMAIVVHLSAYHDDDGEAVEAAELDACEEIKAFVRTGVPGMTIRLVSLQHSAQQMTPLGYVTAQIEAGAVQQTTH